MKVPPCSSQLRSHSRTGRDSAPGSGVIGVKELIRNSLTRGPETALGDMRPDIGVISQKGTSRAHGSKAFFTPTVLQEVRLAGITKYMPTKQELRLRTPSCRLPRFVRLPL
jgi:hypothetical protein